MRAHVGTPWTRRHHRTIRSHDRDTCRSKPSSQRPVVFHVIDLLFASTCPCESSPTLHRRPEITEREQRSIPRSPLASRSPAPDSLVRARERPTSLGRGVFRHGYPQMLKLRNGSPAGSSGPRNDIWSCNPVWSFEANRWSHDVECRELALSSHEVVMARSYLREVLSPQHVLYCH
jgi:hypothetical protein